MSESPSDVTDIPDESLNGENPVSESSTEKRKLSLSQSDNNFDHQKSIRQKLLGKVKSWSSKDQYSKEKTISVELDLAKSLSRIEVAESVEDIASNLIKARDSLENFQKDEQNMPNNNLVHIHAKPRHSPDSPKSSPQLRENWKAGTSKTPFWDPYERQGRKNRKDIKKKNKSAKNTESPRNESELMPVEGKKTSIMKKTELNQNKSSDDAVTNEETSYLEEEIPYKYKYFPKNSKSVVFTNEVLVVYFNNEDIVTEAKEPLKKEVEQQTRNKEMRRWHLIKTQEKDNLCLF